MITKKIAFRFIENDQLKKFNDNDLDRIEICLQLPFLFEKTKIGNVHVDCRYIVSDNKQASPTSDKDESKQNETNNEQKRANLLTYTK